jgi:ubiquinone/menaquinone biosynthesis C-methylase UbiE
MTYLRKAPVPATAVQRLFDGKAVAWPAKYAPGGPLAGRLAVLAGELLRHAGPGARVLDLGCGTGDLARHLAGAGLRLAGCDISAAMLRGAATPGSRARRDPGGPHWVRLSPGWRRLPFATAAFDAVVVSSVLEYTADPVAVLTECARVLRPGGVAVCTVPDLRHPARWLEPLARAAGPVAGPVLGRCWPRWAGYRAYLRTSRQRHRARWWLAAAKRAGLAPVPGRGTARPGGRRCQALRVLVLASHASAAGPGGPGPEPRP